MKNNSDINVISEIKTLVKSQMKLSDITVLDKVSDLDIPWSNFETLKNFIERSDMHILAQPKNNPALVLMMFSDSDRSRLIFYKIFIYVTLLCSFSLAIFVSWWFIFGLFAAIVGIYSILSLQCKVLVKLSLESEEMFCFLYGLGLLVLVDLQDGKRYQRKVCI